MRRTWRRARRGKRVAGAYPRAREGALPESISEHAGETNGNGDGNGHGRTAEPPAAVAKAQTAAPRPKRRRLGRQLVKRRVVTKSAVRQALETQQRSGEPIGKILVNQGAITSATLLLELALQQGVATVAPEDRGIALLPADVALRHSAVALTVGPRPVAPGALTAVGLVDLVHTTAISSVLGRAIEPRLTNTDTFARLFHEAYGMQPPKIQPPEPEPEPEPEPDPAPQAEEPVVAVETNGNHALPDPDPDPAPAPAEPRSSRPPNRRPRRRSRVRPRRHPDRCGDGGRTSRRRPPGRARPWSRRRPRRPSSRRWPPRRF